MVWLKIIVFIMALLPLLLGISLAGIGQLGPSPGETLIIWFAHSGMVLLLLTLSLKPLSYIRPLKPALRLSRMAGLFTFFYVLMHALSYLAFKTGFNWEYVQEDLLERPYIYIGFSAFLILLAMAVTSNRFSQRRLRKNWKRLHRLVYLAVLLSLVHILWVARSDIGIFVMYSMIAFILISCRFFVPRFRSA